jgi:hypothetical protein
MKTMSLPCELTNEEKRLRGEALAQKRQEWEEVERAKKAATQHAKAEQERIDAEADLLAEAIRTGREYRDIEVNEQKNLDSRAMETIRLDTGEVIDSRALRSDEMQTGLWDINAARNRRKGADVMNKMKGGDTGEPETK